MNTVVRTHVSVFLALLAELLLAQSGLVSVLMSAVAIASTTAIGAALALCAALVSAVGTGGPLTPTRIRTAIKDRESRTAFLSQRDPDARGRRRPRAPGRLLPTAA
ncbi:hypothetical protein GCM10020221_35130 [Streptomyces thioluteus]|uniref:Uncharacterized protein n=1 Tax=Streptomyces thioluteus TaxID=66431 RepID=A0ABP6JLC8_STRTU